MNNKIPYIKILELMSDYYREGNAVNVWVKYICIRSASRFNYCAEISVQRSSPNPLPLKFSRQASRPANIPEVMMKGCAGFEVNTVAYDEVNDGLVSANQFIASARRRARKTSYRLR